MQKTLAQLAQEVADLDFTGLDEHQIAEKISAVIGHLSSVEADAAIDLAMRISRSEGERLLAEADELEQHLRLARATGMPEGEKVILWLIEHSLVRRLPRETGYDLTPKGKALRLVEP